MRSVTDTALLEIIKAGEADRVEFKEAVSDGAGIRQAICAFANDLPDRRAPGFVFIGVRDDGTLCGLSVTDQMLRQLADMKTDGNILPPPSLAVEKRRLHGKELALVVVQPSDSPPVRCKGAIYIRIGPRRGLATAQDERRLNEKRRHGDRPFDIQPVPSAGLADLNLTQFTNEYLVQAFSDEVLAANARSLNEQLASTKMIVAADQPTATVLGLLAIGKSPQDFLPGAYVQFLRIHGTHLADDILDAQEIRGALPDLLRQLEEKLMAHNRVAVDATSRSVEHRSEHYPLEALCQFTRNALMHRTYEATHAPVHVYWFNDRIEVMSPGGVFGVVTAERFGEPGFVDYRNPNLADAMKTLGFVQRYGIGIPLARQRLAAAGHMEPEFDITPNVVRITVQARRPAQ